MPYDLPTWMQAEAPSEPWKALVSGVQAGSGIASNILRSRALAEERRQFDIQQERLAQFDEVRNRLFEQEWRLGEIKVATALRSREEQIAAESAYSKVAKLMSDHSLAGIAGTDASEARIWSTIANNPQFYLHPASKDFLSKMQISREAREKASERESLELTKALIAEDARTVRNERTVTGRENVAEIKAESAEKIAATKAEALTFKVISAASKWKEHTAFAALKEKLPRLAAMQPDDDLYAAEVKKLYEKLLPSGEPNELGPAPAPAAAPSETVRVISPDGRPGSIPRSKLEAAKAQGWKEAP